MIAVTTASTIEGYQVMAYKGTAQGANAVFDTCYDDALGIDTLYHGAAVVIEPVKPFVETLMNPESEVPIAAHSRRSQ